MNLAYCCGPQFKGCWRPVLRMSGLRLEHLASNCNSLIEIICSLLVYQDPPSRRNWGYMVINSRYIGSNRGYLEGLGGCCFFCSCGPSSVCRQARTWSYELMKHFSPASLRFAWYSLRQSMCTNHQGSLRSLLRKQSPTPAQPTPSSDQCGRACQFELTSLMLALLLS